MAEHAVYERVLCTGLGDRMGMLLSLAAVASAYNLTSVTMRWCADPMHAAHNNPLHLKYIPEWEGYDYTLEALRTHLRLPSGVRVRMYDAQEDVLLRADRSTAWITDMGSARVPPMQGLPFLPWLGHELFAVAGRPARVTRSRFEAAYASASHALVERAMTYDDAAPVFDVVVHLRAWDVNTLAFADYAAQHYCTRAALVRLTERQPNMTVAVLSHNVTWARAVLGRTLRKKRLLLTPSYVWEDFNTLLAARRGIVQHASNGWSAFSSVPALARALPLLNTYDAPGAEHRFDFFAQYAPVPAPWYRCRDVDAFIARLSV